MWLSPDEDGACEAWIQTPTQVRTQRRRRIMAKAAELLYDNDPKPKTPSLALEGMRGMRASP